MKHLNDNSELRSVREEMLGYMNGKMSGRKCSAYITLETPIGGVVHGLWEVCFANIYFAVGMRALSLANRVPIS
jgi:hypothetical protein